MRRRSHRLSPQLLLLYVLSATVLAQESNNPVVEEGVPDAVLKAPEDITAASAVPVEEGSVLEGDQEIEVLEPPQPQLATNLVLLDGVVPPGSSEILNWEFESDFADISAPVPVLVVNGAEPGPTLCLTAAVHGDELNGIEIVRRVVYELDAAKLSGAVIGVPIVNLEGFKRSTRYLPDRRDLNRYFPGRKRGSYASRIAHSFYSSIISNCDFLVDIHTGSLSRTNLPQIRADLTNPDVAKLAENMGSIVVLQSRGAKGTLRRAAADAGIPAVTLETGAPNNLQKEAVEQGVKTVNSALSSLGLSAKSFWKRNAEPVFYRSQWIRARDGGILFSKVELGDNVKEGAVLGLLSNPITNKTSEIISPIEGRVLGMALNQVMYPGFAAYHVGLKSSVVEAAHPEDLMQEELEDEEGMPDTEEGMMPEEDSDEVPIDLDYAEDVSKLEATPSKPVKYFSAPETEVDEDSPEEKPSKSNAIEDMQLPTAEKRD